MAQFLFKKFSFPSKHQYISLSSNTTEELPHTEPFSPKPLPSRPGILKCAVLLCVIITLLSITVAAYTLSAQYKVFSFEDVIKPTNSSLLNPIFVTEAVTFNPDLKYWNFTSLESEQEWRALGRNGNIYISHPEEYSLAPGIEDPDGTGADALAVSVFHQLHCLRILQQTFAALSTGQALSHDYVQHHPEHCFDYLRQAIMCAGDMSLEGARIEPDGSRKKVDGWGMVHQCKKWDDIEEWMVDNRWKYSV